MTYLLWLVIRIFFEWVILSPRIPDKSLNASMLRLFGRMIGVIGGVIVLAYGAQEIGLPVFSILAGLGIGGLAIALAIRPTLENLIGGFIIFLDKPVEVGDFCEFGDRKGTVEMIGVRSTQIRDLNRTLISIPNAQFADMAIANWARCDKMQILGIIGLRYETEADQLRYVLARAREMFLAHPRIDNDTIRVRFIGLRRVLAGHRGPRLCAHQYHQRALRNPRGRVPAPVMTSSRSPAPASLSRR